MAKELSQRTTAYHEAGHAVVANELGRKVTKVTIQRNDSALGFSEDQLEYDAVGLEGHSAFTGHMTTILAVLTSPQVDSPISIFAKQLFEDDRYKTALDILEQTFGNGKSANWLERKLTEAVYEALILIAMAGEAAECALESRDSLDKEGRSEPDWTGGSSDDYGAVKTMLEALSETNRFGDRYNSGYDSYATKSYETTLWVRSLALVNKHWSDIEAVADALLEQKTLTGDEVRQVIKVSKGVPPGFEAL